MALDEEDDDDDDFRDDEFSPQEILDDVSKKFGGVDMRPYIDHYEMGPFKEGLLQLFVDNDLSRLPFFGYQYAGLNETAQTYASQCWDKMVKATQATNPPGKKTFEADDIIRFCEDINAASSPRLDYESLIKCKGAVLYMIDSYFAFLQKKSLEVRMKKYTPTKQDAAPVISLYPLKKKQDLKLYKKHLYEIYNNAQEHEIDSVAPIDSSDFFLDAVLTHMTSKLRIAKSKAEAVVSNYDIYNICWCKNLELPAAEQHSDEEIFGIYDKIRDAIEKSVTTEEDYIKLRPYYPESGEDKFVSLTKILSNPKQVQELKEHLIGFMDANLPESITSDSDKLSLSHEVINTCVDKMIACACVKDSHQAQGFSSNDFSAIFAGIVKEKNIPEELYKEICDTLFVALVTTAMQHSFLRPPLSAYQAQKTAQL